MFDFYKIRKNKVHKFQPKVKIFLDKGPYVLKTITTVDELIESLKLRYQVFHRELIGKTKPTGIDVDEFDFICDHLIIIDKKSNQIVGTYRLNCSLFSNQFYSAQEFNLRTILETKGTKLELGRACIHKDFRNGYVINLLWRGIAQYMQATHSEILFGCASIKTESPRIAAMLYKYFQSQGHLSEDYHSSPTLNFVMPELNLWLAATPSISPAVSPAVSPVVSPAVSSSIDSTSSTTVNSLNNSSINLLNNSQSNSTINSQNMALNMALNIAPNFSLDTNNEIESLIPPLCRAYFKAGAFLCGEPAYDKEFKCIDFLTVLPRENLNKAIWKRYAKNTEYSHQATMN